MIKRFYKPKSSFIFVKMSGNINDDEFLNHVIELAHETKDRTVYHELYDLREITSESNISLKCCIDLQKIISNNINLFFITGKIALLVKNSFQLNIARAFIAATSSVIIKRKMNIFYSSKEAIESLNTGETYDSINKFMINTEQYSDFDFETIQLEVMQ